MSSRNVLSNLRIQDPVLTELVHTYCQAEALAPWVAPFINVPARDFYAAKHDKESFAVVDTLRAPCDNIKTLGTTYGSERYTVKQHAVGVELCFEEIEAANNGMANIDLEQLAANRLGEALTQSWESEVMDFISNANVYEANLVVDVSAVPTDQFDDPGSDPEAYLFEQREKVELEIGCPPNSMIIGKDVWKALKFHPLWRGRYDGSPFANRSVQLDQVAQWLEFENGVRVAYRKKLNCTTNVLEYMFDPKSIVMFYSPVRADNFADKNGALFQQLPDLSGATPSAFYSFGLRGYPVIEQPFDDLRKRVRIWTGIAEQSIQGVGLGSTGLVGGAILLQNVVS